MCARQKNKMRKFWWRVEMEVEVGVGVCNVQWSQGGCSADSSRAPAAAKQPPLGPLGGVEWPGG